MLRPVTRTPSRAARPPRRSQPPARPLAKPPARPLAKPLAKPPATPLAALLTSRDAPARVTPLDVFQLARQKWLAGERLDIGKLAEELGVGRATVFRWVGSREQLYGEVISSLFASALERAQREAHGVGPAYLADVTHRLLHALLDSEPLRRFVQQDTEFALRVLMSRNSPVEHRCTSAVRALLEAQAQAGHIRPAMDIEALAYVVVRIGESFLYRDVLTGDAPDIETATQAIRILYAAQPEASPPPRPRSRATGRNRHRGAT
jgi:AcrR family transcriptional regulator